MDSSQHTTDQRTLQCETVGECTLKKAANILILKGCSNSRGDTKYKDKGSAIYSATFVKEKIIEETRDIEK